jgi:rRNA maturation endonuclease Nob1
MVRFVQGRCWRCKLAFRWKSGKGRRLKDTKCPSCGGDLVATAHYLKSVPWFSLDGSDPTIPQYKGA